MSRQKKKRVIYTAITAEKDPLRKPRHWLPDTDYICFTDQKISWPHRFKIRPLPWQEATPRLTARRCKFFAHTLFPEYEESMWMDGSIEIRADISPLWQKAFANAHMAAYMHPERNCLYDEAENCMQSGRAPVEDLRAQMQHYQDENMPVNKGLYETSVLFRRHNTPAVMRLCESWWNEITTRSVRDQVSLPYVLWKQNMQMEALPHGKEHDHYFLHHAHRWHAPEDNRSQLWHRLLAVAHIVAQRTHLQAPYSALKNWLKGTRT